MWVFLLLVSGGSSLAANLSAEISGLDVLSGKEVVLPAPSKKPKGTVAVFLSAKCPCSDSHIEDLKKLFRAYPDFRFVGIHANPDESLELSKSYFKKAQLPFPVLEDNKSRLANAFKALKTPHAFVLNPKGEILYQGGVTNSIHAKAADKHFLADALEDIQQGREVRTKNGRTLGCIIMREGEENSW